MAYYVDFPFTICLLSRQKSRFSYIPLLSRAKSRKIDVFFPFFSPKKQKRSDNPHRFVDKSADR